MANYNIDIGVKVQAQQLEKFNIKLLKTSKLIDNANKSIKNFEKNNLSNVRSINGVNEALNAATINFRKVATGTPQATRAAKEFVQAEQLVNKTLAEQEKLLENIRRKQQNKQFTLGLRRQGFKKNQILQSDGTFINQRRAELQIANRAATLEDRINQTLAKRGKILSANGKQIKSNNVARSAGVRGGRFQNALSSGLIGGGFPLLFGQGPTAAIGGALGGVAGGAIGGQFGFALSIAGTTIGSALDSLANALAKPTENIQLLVDKVGLANTPTGDLALRLEKVGLSASAADLLLDEFNKKFGKTPEDIKKNTEQMNKFKNQINELGTAITLLLSKVLSPAIQTILNFINTQAIANKVGRPKLASLQLEAAGLARTETKKKFGFNFGAVEGPLAGEGVSEFFQKREKEIFNNLVNEEINKQLVAQGKPPVDFTNQELNFGDKFEALQKKAAQAEFNKNIRSLEQSLKLEKDRLNISSEQFTLKQEEFKLSNLNKDLELLRGELGKDNNLEIQRQVDGLQAQVDLQQQIVNNAKALADPFRELSNIIAQDIGNGIKGLIKGTETLNNVLKNVLNKLADAFLNKAIFGNVGGQFQRGGAGGLLGSVFGLFSGSGNNIMGGPKGGYFDSVTGKGIAGPNFGLADGGIAKAGRTHLVGERGPELFTPGVSGMITPNHALGGSTNVVVNVDASGSSVEGDEQSANEFGEQIAAAVQAVIINEKRVGGLLS